MEGIDAGRRNLHGACECPKEADLGLACTGRDLDGVGRVGWVTNADFYSPVRVVFKVAQEEMVKRMAKEEAKGGIINDVCVDFKHNIADSHGQIFGTAESLADRAIGSLHIDVMPSVDVHASF